MRPPSQFGNDITNQSNTPNNNNNNGGNNNEDNNGGGGGGGGGGIDTSEFPPSIAHMGGTLIFTRQAGRAVIRVVGRCEDAKENGSALGESKILRARGRQRTVRSPFVWPAIGSRSRGM